MSHPDFGSQFSDITEHLHHDIYPAIDPGNTLKGSCANKTILITGAGRGIGKAMALAFAAAGASTIILTSRSMPELTQARTEILAQPGSAVDVITHSVDVTSEESVKNLFDTLAARNIVLDVLVNNAGYLDKHAVIHESSPASWWKTWEVNVKGAYLPMHFALQLHRAPHALTVICTSTLVSTLTVPSVSAYTASKAAVNRFVEFVDAEYAARGVRAFAFHPGDIPTALAESVMPPEWEHVYPETVELAGGFAVWLAGQKDADHFRGKYVSALWDVGEMVAAAEAKSPEEKGRWLTTKLIV